MPDFWRSSGFHLLVRDDDGHLAVTDDGKYVVVGDNPTESTDSMAARAASMFGAMRTSKCPQKARSVNTTPASPDAN